MMQPTFKLRYHLLAFAAGAVLAAICGVNMMHRHEAGLSWETWTLGLFLSVYLSGISLWTIRWKADRFRWRLFGLSSISGIALSVGFPPMPFTPILFVALVPLFMVQREVETYNTRQNTQPVRLSVFVFHAFLLWNILSTYWVANAQWAAGVFANTVNAAILCLPILLWHQTRKVMTGSVTRVALVSYWLAFEYLHHRWELAWPWLSLGNALGEWPVFAQWYTYTGVLGGTLWIVMANIFIFRLVRHHFYGISIKKTGVTRALIFWLLVPVGISVFLYTKPQQPSSMIEVVLVQPDVDPYGSSGIDSDEDRVRRLLSLAEPLITDSTRYVIFPESALGVETQNQLGKQSGTALLNRWLADQPGLRIITGLTLVEWFPLGADDHPPFVQRRRSDDGSNLTHYAVYNAAVQLDGTTAPIQFSYKSKLVPGAETFPYRQYLGFLNPLLDLFGGGGAGFGYQKERVVFQGESSAASPLICYESAFGEFVTSFVKNGAEVLFIITNDSWWGDTAGYKQHLRMASLRAIETGRAIGRCANGGVSAFISPKGTISQCTRYETTNAIRGELPLATEMTFYSKFGDLIGRIALFLGLLLMVNVLAKMAVPGDA